MDGGVQERRIGQCPEPFTLTAKNPNQPVRHLFPMPFPARIRGGGFRGKEVFNCLFTNIPYNGTLIKGFNYDTYCWSI
jgi:hypothetical protein